MKGVANMNYDNKPKHISVMGSTAHTYGNALAFIQNWHSCS